MGRRDQPSSWPSGKAGLAYASASVSDVETRQPTLEEAIKWIVSSLTDEYRKICIEHWRGLYGDSFANTVRAEAWIRIKRKR